MLRNGTTGLIVNRDILAAGRIWLECNRAWESKARGRNCASTLADEL